MNNFTYFFSTSSNTDNVSVRLDPIIFKGSTNITFDFTGIDQTGFPAIKLHVDWGDRSERILESASYDLSTGLPVFDLDTLSHVYQPSAETYYLGLTAQAQIIFANFKIYSATIPIIFAQPSYLEEYEGLELIDAQFIDNADNDIFAVYQSLSGNVYNVVMKSAD